MFIVDFIIANTDRHLNNFGFIRNADTLEWKGEAPIYDSGKAMFKDCTEYELKEILNGTQTGIASSKPFETIHERQICILPVEQIFRTMDLSALDGIGIYYRNILEKSLFNERISEERKDLLSRILDKRLEYIKNISLKVTNRVSLSTMNYDRIEALLTEIGVSVNTEETSAPQDNSMDDERKSQNNAHAL